MNAIAQASPAVSEEQLWRLTCEDDREAPTRIVERCQFVIRSLAYSACGWTAEKKRIELIQCHGRGMLESREKQLKPPHQGRIFRGGPRKICMPVDGNTDLQQEK
jgi:hypothetical protein